MDDEQMVDAPHSPGGGASPIRPTSRRNDPKYHPGSEEAQNRRVSKYIGSRERPQPERPGLDQIETLFSIIEKTPNNPRPYVAGDHDDYVVDWVKDACNAFTHIPGQRQATITDTVRTFVEAALLFEEGITSVTRHVLGDKTAVIISSGCKEAAAAVNKEYDDIRMGIKIVVAAMSEQDIDPLPPRSTEKDWMDWVGHIPNKHDHEIADLKERLEAAQHDAEDSKTVFTQHIKQSKEDAAAAEAADEANRETIAELQKKILQLQNPRDNALTKELDADVRAFRSKRRLEDTDSSIDVSRRMLAQFGELHDLVFSKQLSEATSVADLFARTCTRADEIARDLERIRETVTAVGISVKRPGAAERDGGGASVMMDTAEAARANARDKRHRDDEEEKKEADAAVGVGKSAKTRVRQSDPVAPRVALLIDELENLRQAVRVHERRAREAEHTVNMVRVELNAEKEKVAAAATERAAIQNASRGEPLALPVPPLAEDVFELFTNLRSARASINTLQAGATTGANALASAGLQLNTAQKALAVSEENLRAMATLVQKQQAQWDAHLQNCLGERGADSRDVLTVKGMLFSMTELLINTVLPIYNALVMEARLVTALRSDSVNFTELPKFADQLAIAAAKAIEVSKEVPKLNAAISGHANSYDAMEKSKDKEIEKLKVELEDVKKQNGGYDLKFARQADDLKRALADAAQSALRVEGQTKLRANVTALTAECAELKTRAESLAGRLKLVTRELESQKREAELAREGHRQAQTQSVEAARVTAVARAEETRAHRQEMDKIKTENARLKERVVEDRKVIDFYVRRETNTGNVRRDEQKQLQDRIIDQAAQITNIRRNQTAAEARELEYFKQIKPLKARNVELEAALAGAKQDAQRQRDETGRLQQIAARQTAWAAEQLKSVEGLRGDVEEMTAKAASLRAEMAAFISELHRALFSAAFNLYGHTDIPYQHDIVELVETLSIDNVSFRAALIKLGVQAVADDHRVRDESAWEAVLRTLVPPIVNVVNGAAVPPLGVNNPAAAAALGVNIPPAAAPPQAMRVIRRVAHIADIELQQSVKKGNVIREVRHDNRRNTVCRIPGEPLTAEDDVQDRLILSIGGRSALFKGTDAVYDMLAESAVGGYASLEICTDKDIVLNYITDDGVFHTAFGGLFNGI